MSFAWARKIVPISNSFRFKFFWLIIFFMVTTTFQARSGISVKLPEAGSKLPVREVTRAVVSIKADGTMFLEDERVDEGLLAKKLEKLATSGGRTLVVIRADKSVPHGRVVTVMDIARTAGLTDIAIATVLKMKPGGAP